MPRAEPQGSSNLRSIVSATLFLGYSGLTHEKGALLKTKLFCVASVTCEPALAFSRAGYTVRLGLEFKCQESLTL